MKTKLIYIVSLILAITLSACGDKNESNNDWQMPTIQFPVNPLDVDLNKVDNLPVIAVVNAEAGLKEVKVDIQTEKGVENYKTINEFYNNNTYSLAEYPDYDTSYRGFIIEATDKLDHLVSDTLFINVKGIIKRPVISFSLDSIVYDEMEDKPVIPKTAFNVISEAGLKSVETFLVSIGGQVSMGTADLNGETEYQFDELINYKEGDKGFKVKAVDVYGNTTIATLPVIYRALPIPKISLKDNVVYASSGVDVAIPMKVSSVKGLKGIDLYRIEGNQEKLAKHVDLQGEKSADISPVITLTQSTSKVLIKVSDGRIGKEAVAYVKTYVDMKVGTLNIGSQVLANTGHKDYPQALGMVSLNDMKTYSVDYAISSGDNAKNIDFKFYCYGGQAIPRLYSMDNTEKSSEYKGTTGNLTKLPVKNATRFAILSNFDYDNATVTDIKGILSSSITTSKLTPFGVGNIIAFRTGSTSTSGKGKIGVMKVVKIISAKSLGLSNATANILVVEIKMPIR